MGYQVKWVEDHLGITRKALRGYEEKGLIPKNKDGKYREYSDDQIERLWQIKLLQGTGYSLDEIREMFSCNQLDFDKSLKQKITELRKRKKEIDDTLGYAEMIEMSGRMPYLPKEMGTMTANEFLSQALNKWNMNNQPEMRTILDIINIY